MTIEINDPIVFIGSRLHEEDIPADINGEVIRPFYDVDISDDDWEKMGKKLRKILSQQTIEGNLDDNSK